jgi:DNA-binding transcriptional MerR regulator
MTGASHYSVRQMANELSLAESTVRYYRDTYAPFLLVVGSGPRRLYPVETLERLRFIRDGYAEGLDRTDIETRLREKGTPLAPSENGSTAIARYDDVLATILDGERERREAMWQVAREIVRLGEVVERQQVLLGAIADHVGASDQAIDLDGDDVELIPVGEAATIDGTVEAELAALREQLENERDLVERLRRSKVEMERRAAQAEELLAEQGGDDATARRRSLLRRFLLRDSDT